MQWLTYNDNDSSCRPRGSDWIANGSATASPESNTVYTDNLPLDVLQASWSSPVTSRLLLEAGFSSFHSRWGWTPPPGALTNFIPVTETAVECHHRHTGAEFHVPRIGQSPRE